MNTHGERLETRCDRSGVNPNSIVLAGCDARAELLRRALAGHWRFASPDDAIPAPAGAIYMEAAGEARYEQLAALRAISAIAPDDAVIISTSPVLAHGEIAGSVTHPARLISLVPPWTAHGSTCEIIPGPKTCEATRQTAWRLAREAGWSVLVEQGGGPSALTRLQGSVLIESWNLARRTGRPAEVDRSARAAQLPWSPLREIDRIGLRRLAQAFGRAEQAVGIESIYASEASDELSAAFAANCGNDLIAAGVREGYFLHSAMQAAATLLNDGLLEDRSLLRRALVAAFGRSLARRLSSAPLARYADETLGASLTSPNRSD